MTIETAPAISHSPATLTSLAEARRLKNTAQVLKVSVWAVAIYTSAFLDAGDIHFGAAASYRSDRLHNAGKFGFLGGKVKALAILGERGKHYCLALVGEGLPNFLGNKGHKGMEQLKCARKHIAKNASGRLFGLLVLSG